MNLKDYLKSLASKYRHIDRQPILNNADLARISYTKCDQELANIKDGEVEKQIDKLEKLKWGEKIVKRTVYNKFRKKKKKV